MFKMKDDPCVANCLLSCGFFPLMCSASLIEISKSFFPVSKTENILTENLALQREHEFK